MLEIPKIHESFHMGAIPSDRHQYTFSSKKFICKDIANGQRKTWITWQKLLAVKRIFESKEKCWNVWRKLSSFSFKRELEIMV